MFDNKRIYHGNLNDYMDKPAKRTFKNVNNIPFLLQKDYGLAKDCTLTSITTLLSWKMPELPVEQIYNQVENVAKRYGYNGEKYGTINLTITSIINTLFSIYGIKEKAKGHHIKCLTYSFETIKKLIDAGKPVILNIGKDGRNYYKSHTVLISGYVTSDNYEMLAVHDNWFSTTSYVDYKRLNILTSIITF